MFLEFHFWRYFFDRGILLQNLTETESIRGFKKRVGIVFVCTILLYIFMSSWGMTSSSLTTLYISGFTDTYIAARWVSLIGIISFAILYFCFHFFGMSQLFHIITKIPLRVAAIMQLYVISILLIEKFIIVLVFMLIGYTTPFSFLSFGPLAVHFLDFEFFYYFFNQFSVFTALIIAIQLQFIRKFTDLSSKVILALLFSLLILFAAITGLISVLPIEEFIGGLL
ncbi:hypothetical protein LG275_12500 [Chryseomicrobium palamuruense]